MEVKITKISSIIDGMRSMYMSKRSWNDELEQKLQEWDSKFISKRGGIQYVNDPDWDEFYKTCKKLFKWGQIHSTMLRYIDITCIVNGLHRGATDDFDSHAKRLENRIIRSSTRLADYGNEKSDWYKDKILTTDEALEKLRVKLPETIIHNNQTYVRTTNGYVLEEYKDNRDVKRGLCMLSIPMTFTFKCNITELAHIYRERGSKEYGAHGTAAPELQEMMETLIDELNKYVSFITRDYLLKIVQ